MDFWQNRRRSAFLATKYTSYGYILEYSPNHHFAQKSGHVYQHRLVWERHNKATLLPWGIIRHKNGKTDDNRIENLKAMMYNDKAKFSRH